MIAFRPHIDYDVELEEKVLGVFLMEPHSYALVISILREECFCGNTTKKFYCAIRDLYEKGYGIDYLVVQRHFFDQEITEIDGVKIAYTVMVLQTGVLSSAHLVTWCLLLRELAVNRMMYQLKNSGSLKGDAFEEAAAMEQKIKDIMDVKVTDDWVHISQVAVKLSKHMDEVAIHGIQGVSTSIKELDELNSGFRNTNLIVIGARPSVGKSAFMGRIAINAAKKGKIVGIISLEMEDKDIFARGVGSEADVDLWRIDKNDFHQEDEQRKLVYDTMGSLAKLPIYYSDTAQVTMTDIRAKAEKLKAKNGVDLLIIDYLGLIEPESSNYKNRQEEVQKMSRGLKLLAMNMKIPIIILAQLNRQAEEKGDKKPMLHHLRESGSIEQDADVVMFLHSDFRSGILVDETGRKTDDRVDLLVRKWRSGCICDIKLGFDMFKTKFWELSQESPFNSPTPAPTPPDKPNAGFPGRATGPVPDNYWDDPK